MSEKLIFVLRAKPHLVRQNIAQALATAPDGYIVTIQPPKRSLEQNAKLWAMLKDIADQVVWHGKKLISEQWKDLFTASLFRQTVVPNLEGDGFIACGTRTSKMSVREMADLIELMYAFGSERGVVWSEPKEDFRLEKK
jgi:NinB protein